MSDVVQLIEKMQTSQESSSSSHYVGIAAPADSKTSLESRSRTKHEGKFIIGSAMTSSFVLEDLLRASAEVLGKGTIGTTYKVTLESGYTLVVKRLRAVDLREEEFDLRVAVIGAIQNKHIAPLQWYYWSNDEKMLVYDYFPMGSLADALHGRSPTLLCWEQRICIALDVARGVAYIHSAGPSSCHGNIKSSNVMLTGTLDAYLSEHGLTALGLFPGASGYSAPEITDDKWFSQKADVYSFGVLLLELLTRKAPVNNTQLEGAVNLPKWVRSVAQQEWASLVIDMELLRQLGQDGVTECMVQLLQLALHCCSKDVNSRTTMSDVVQLIEKMQTSQESSSSSHYVGIAAPADSKTSLESRSRTKHEGKFIIGSAMTSSFVLEDLLRASAEVLGKGTIGTTYKGTLESGYTLVVKRLRSVNLPTEEFDRRVAVIGTIQNKHIAPLQWYYWSNDERLVVYDFFPMGSLAHVLHDPVPSTPLGWEQRAAIALAVARGVAYIHSAGPSSCHGNIKSSNVMLTDTLDAYVSEHGLTALGLFPGASGYSAPEITDDKWVSQEADVYSFGVLLLELLTRKIPVNNSQLEDRVNLPQWVCSIAQHEWAAKVIDVELLAQPQKDGVKEFMVLCMVRLLQLAIDCCSEDANSRTTMSYVVQQIKKVQTSQKSSSSSHYVGIAAAAESTKSQESSSSMEIVGNFIVGSTMTSLFVDLADLLLGTSEFLGEGPVGTTYKVTLESGYTLVVKRLRAVDLPKEEFDLRATVIGAIQNKHIAPLHWYYWNDVKLLVYNFFPMGSLAYALHGYGAPLAWDQRVAIALAVARGLAYIHLVGPSSCHGNIKSSNVMLTGTHDARVSEHDLAALGPFPGASGYSAPEITDDKWVSQKADVYSFGVLLLELLTRKTPFKSIHDDLPRWVCSIAYDKGLLAVIDSQLLAQQKYDREEQSMILLLHLGTYCCRYDADSRPTMSSLVQRIEKMQT